MIPALTDKTFCGEVLCHKGIALVQFSAEWSGTSHLMMPTLDRIGREYDGRLRVFHIDVDANPRARKRFAVHGVPTLLLFDRGLLVAGYSGAVSSSRIARDVEEILDRGACRTAGTQKTTMNEGGL